MNDDLVTLTPTCPLCNEPAPSGIHSKCYFERVRRAAEHPAGATTPGPLASPPVRELVADCLIVIGLFGVPLSLVILALGLLR